MRLQLLFKWLERSEWALMFASHIDQFKNYNYLSNPHAYE